jgi:DNA-binding MarR family transcriptional regulator
MSKAETRAAGEQRHGVASTPDAERRVKRRTAEVVKSEKEPLRRRILAALAEGPATTTKLSRRFDKSTPHVNRVLKEFLDAGCVVKEGGAADRRHRLYFLTPAGEAKLNEFTTFGARQEPPPRLSDGRARELARKAIDRAVRIRREENRLGEAASRLRAVIREAEKIGAHELVLEATVELAKTLRQDRQRDDQEALNAGYAELVERLNEIALGNAEGYEADLVLPAAAHLRFLLGRAGDRRDDDLQTREAHLIAARELYGQLVNNSRPPASRDWFERRAWSVLSLAGNLRKQTQLEPALRAATRAKHSFDLLEDDYGRAHSYFMFGFCLRLLGEFREATVCLDRAHQLADANSFQRLKADALMQMGDVKRCLGELDEAREMLGSALGYAGEMELLVTQAFAQSALGAVEYQRGNFGEARESLEVAEKLFESCDHAEGDALNTKRQASVARKVAKESSRPSYAACERLISTAYEGYFALHSPAGLAACVIENGWVRLMRKSRQVKPAVGRLKELLADHGRREYLELDPWVPQLMVLFARDAEDTELVAESELLLTTAREKLHERGARGVDQVAAVMPDLKLEDEDELDPSIAEMGGEARRESSAFEHLAGTEQCDHEMAFAA